MNDTHERLANCFAAVFPKLEAKEIPRASTLSVAGWDSLASATLLMVVEEEFNIQINPERLEHLQSFGALFDEVSRERHAVASTIDGGSAR